MAPASIEIVCTRYMVHLGLQFSARSGLCGHEPQPRNPHRSGSRSRSGLPQVTASPSHGVVGDRYCDFPKDCQLHEHAVVFFPVQSDGKYGEARAPRRGKRKIFNPVNGGCGSFFCRGTPSLQEPKKQIFNIQTIQ